MNQHEAFQLLGVVYSLSTYETRASTEAMSMTAGTWAVVLESVPYEWARDFVLAKAKEGAPVRDVTSIAAGYKSYRKSVIAAHSQELVPPDELPPGAQGQWLRLARRALGDGAPVRDASAWADTQMQVTRALTAGSGGSQAVPAEQSIARLRQITAQWALKRSQEAANHAKHQ